MYNKNMEQASNKYKRVLLVDYLSCLIDNIKDGWFDVSGVEIVQTDESFDDDSILVSISITGKGLVPHLYEFMGYDRERREIINEDL